MPPTPTAAIVTKKHEGEATNAPAAAKMVKLATHASEHRNRRKYSFPQESFQAARLTQSDA